MHRFFTDAGGVVNGRARLDPEDARHCVRVLRLSAGDPVELLSGGARWEARITQIDHDGVLAEIVQELPPTESRLRVTLFQGLPKGDKMDLIVQKSVELGVDTIVPVLMDRCISRPDSSDSKKKRGRWQKIAREACKQSGRCTETTVCEPIAFQALPEYFSGLDAVCAPWEEARGTGPRAFCLAHPEIKTLGVVIGPEGGISVSEIGRLSSAGCVPITLGPRILRTETAGLAAISALMALYGEME